MKEQERSYYTKTDYNGVVTVRNSKTGKMEKSETNRTVYRNSRMNPDLVIPVGTKIGKEITKKEMTNLERMREGKSPLIQNTDKQGKISYDRIDLHHLLSQERHKNNSKDGSLVELTSSIHKKYHKQLHAIRGNETSWRVKKVKKITKDGKVRRGYMRSADAARFDKIKKQYWRDYASEIDKTRSHDAKLKEHSNTNKDTKQKKTNQATLVRQNNKNVSSKQSNVTWNNSRNTNTAKQSSIKVTWGSRSIGFTKQSSGSKNGQKSGNGPKR